MFATKLKEHDEKLIRQSETKGIIKGKIETARQMRKEGLSNELIARVTGLSIEEIEKL